MAQKVKDTIQDATAQEIMRELCEERGWTQAELAHEVGYASQSSIGNLLSSVPRDFRIGVFCKVVKGLGAEIIVRDKMGSGKEWRIK